MRLKDVDAAACELQMACISLVLYFTLSQGGNQTRANYIKLNRLAKPSVVD